MKKQMFYAAAALSGLLAGTAARAATIPAVPVGETKSISTAQLNHEAGFKASTLADEAKGKHDCKGKNACKGQGGCKTDKSDCKGQNACKGQGGCKTNA